MSRDLWRPIFGVQAAETQHLQAAAIPALNRPRWLE